MAEMATRWQRSTARPMVTVAQLLDRAAAASRGSTCPPAVSEPEPAVSVDALLRREGRATQAQDGTAHPHRRRSPIPDGGSPGRARRTAVAASTLLAAGSVVGVALASNTPEYELGNTAQPVNDPPVGQSSSTPTGELALVPGEQAPILGAAASTGAPAAGSGPSADWTAVAFPPTAGPNAGDPTAISAETSDTTVAAAPSSDEASAADPEPRGNDTSASDDDDSGSRSSDSDSRGSASTPASSAPKDDDVVLADGGSARPAPATPEAATPEAATPEAATPEAATPDAGAPDDPAPEGAAAGGAAAEDGESGEESNGGATVDDPNDQDTPPVTDDSTEKAPAAVDESSSSTDSDSDEASVDSDAKTDSSSADEPDGAAVAPDSGDDGSTDESAA